jgi:proteic killer suppression protein
VYVIESFRSRDTEKLYRDEPCPRFRSIERVARRKLRLLGAAKELSDLGKILGNRLEPLRGARQGQHSIRINSQWRLCFVWRNGAAYEVEVTDYH